MGNSLTFPSLPRPPLGDRFNRWVSRWSRGGVEHYGLGRAGIAGREVPLAWELGAGIEVTQQQIGLSELPEVFQGFRVVQISDIHHGLFFPLSAVRDAVETANRMDADVIALTGDFVTYSRAYIEPVAHMLSELRARHGVFAVLGNHDYRVGAEAIVRALRRQRIEVLRNRHTVLRRRGQALHLAGIDDYGYGADLPRALQGIPRGAATLLLAHNPRIIRQAARHRIGLVLSGHTHGGQVNLPVLGTIYGRSPGALRYRSGWDRLGATQIYVSRGIGTVVLPLRVRCRAEIPHLELQRGETACGPSPEAPAES
jgi:predicted MPP superfamily phosphohydrolase